VFVVGLGVVGNGDGEFIGLNIRQATSELWVFP